jgi:peptide/nickel transport system substrate-binding protein
LERRQRSDAKPQEETVRRREGSPGIDPGDRPLARRAGIVENRYRQTVGGIVFPGSPLAASQEELEQIAGYWPDIDKSRSEARRLLKEAGAEGLSFELLNRNVDQPYKYVRTWLIDEWSKIGLHVTQRVVPSGPWFEAMRNGDFDVVLKAPGGPVNPLLNVQKALPASVDAENYGHFEDATEIDLYEKLLHETDPAQQRSLMRGSKNTCSTTRRI